MHAARQPGTTSCLLEYMRYLNAAGKFHCVYANIESAQGCRDDVTKGMTVVAQAIANDARVWTGDALPQKILRELMAEGIKVGVFSEFTGENPARRNSANGRMNLGLNQGN